MHQFAEKAANLDAANKASEEALRHTRAERDQKAEEVETLKQQLHRMQTSAEEAANDRRREAGAHQAKVEEVLRSAEFTTRQVQRSAADKATELAAANETLRRTRDECDQNASRLSALKQQMLEAQASAESTTKQMQQEVTDLVAAEKVSEEVIRRTREECDRNAGQVATLRKQITEMQASTEKATIDRRHEADARHAEMEKTLRSALEEARRSRKAEVEQLTERLSTTVKTLDEARDEAIATRKADAKAAADNLAAARRDATKQTTADHNIEMQKTRERIEEMCTEHRTQLEQERNEARKVREALALEQTSAQRQLEEVRQNLQTARAEINASTQRADAVAKEKDCELQREINTNRKLQQDVQKHTTTIDELKDHASQLSTQHEREKGKLQRRYEEIIRNNAEHALQLQQTIDKYDQRQLFMERERQDAATQQVAKLEAQQEAQARHHARELQQVAANHAQQMQQLAANYDHLATENSRICGWMEYTQRENTQLRKTVAALEDVSEHQAIEWHTQQRKQNPVKQFASKQEIDQSPPEQHLDPAAVTATKRAVPINLLTTLLFNRFCEVRARRNARRTALHERRTSSPYCVKGIEEQTAD
jgi:chromosome segregation ATPase